MRGGIAPVHARVGARFTRSWGKRRLLIMNVSVFGGLQTASGCGRLGEAIVAGVAVGAGVGVGRVGERVCDVVSHPGIR